MRPLPLLVGLSLAVAVGAKAGPRPGKVVRVERRSHTVTGIPRYCNVSPGDLTAYCIGGRAPVVGERIEVLDTARLIGALRITAVTPLPDGCNQNAIWMIQGVAESGDFSNPQGQTLGVLDVPLDARQSRLVNVDRSPSGHAWGSDQIWAIDTNGDDSADVEFTQFPCDDAGNASTSPSGTCIEVWMMNPGHGLEKLREDRVRNCF